VGELRVRKALHAASTSITIQRNTGPRD
jgi:hypothetical protein